jgi:ankyrin repeat protein
MKKLSFSPVLLSVFLSILPLAICCKGTPAANNEESPVWGLLGKGDDKARNYFMGEIDIDAVDSNGRSPLHYAAERKDAQLAQFFIDLGANPNIIDNEGQTPLGICIGNNSVQTAAVLASGGADIHQPIPSVENTTAAILTLEKNYTIFKAILNPNTVNTTDASGKTILHIAVILGNLDAVSEILSVSPSSTTLINRKDNEDKNSLDCALERAYSKIHIAIAEQLILAGGYCDNPIFAYFGPAVRSVNYNIRRNEGMAPIHYAVMENHLGLVTFLLDKKIDINIKTTSGATALHEACRTGNVDIVSLLINNNADVNAKDASGNTPLHVGIPQNAFLDTLSMLLAAGAEVNLRDDHGDTPVHIAVMLNRSAESVQLMLKAGGDVHIRNINGKTPLFIAVQEHRLALIPLLISSGSEIFAVDNDGITPFDISSKANDGTFNLLITNETINQRDSQGNTMLHCAVKNQANSGQIARILDQRAPVDSRNREGDTALHIAVRTNQRESGEYLLTRGADIFSLNSAGENPLFLALGTNNIREWIINSRTVTAKDGLGNNMLHYAAEWGMNNAISIMIRNGINVDTQNATGQTPLFMATKSENPETLRIFIENNANLNIRDSQGNNALHAAVRWNAVKSVSFLLSTDIDINANSFNGNTPLHDAVILNLAEIETLLIRRGADLESKNIDGNTPLMEAIRCGLLPSIEILSSSGADTSTRNTRGDTPLHIAVGLERIDIANILLRTNASIHARNTRNRTPFQISLSVSPGMVAALLGNNRIFISDDFGNSVLHIALLEKSSDDIIRTIVNQGARVNAVDNNGKTPLRLAVDSEAWSSAKIIADSGADPFLAAVDNKSPAEISFSKGEVCIRSIFSGKAINAKDGSGNTILHFAARLGTPEIIYILFELGANKSVKNISSENPNDIAVRWNRIEISELLR